MPLKQAQWLFGAQDRVTAMVVMLDDVTYSPIVTEELKDHLDERYEAMSWQLMMPELEQMIRAENAENGIFLLILYILISFGIFGTILMMTMERQYEFGVLVAIGMKKSRLSGVVILENIFISLLGAGVGLVLSIPVVGYFHKYPIHVGGKLKEAYEKFGFEPVFYFSMEPYLFYSQALLVLAIALVLSVYPTLKISWLNPVEAMRD